MTLRSRNLANTTKHVNTLVHHIEYHHIVESEAGEMASGNHLTFPNTFITGLASVLWRLRKLWQQMALARRAAHVTRRLTSSPQYRLYTTSDAFAPV